MSSKFCARQPLTLLVVAPHQDILNLVKAVLVADGHRVVVADSEAAGFALAEAEQPDVILALSGVHDIGPSLCVRVRQEPRLAKTPFVVLTTSSHSRTYASYFSKGCDHILPVPFKCQDLYAAIHSACRPTQEDQHGKVHVLLKSGRADFIDPTELDQLLAARQVLCFRRSNGLVMIGCDPVRARTRPDYAGPERRLIRT